jgi:glycosyltransferase involved in cell wall biosynthesis
LWSAIGRFGVIIGWLKMVSILRRQKFSHLHLVANHGVFVNFMVFFSFALPPMSFCIFGTENGKTKSYTIQKVLSLRFGSRGAAKVDCLTPAYKEYAESIIPQRFHAKIRVAPCSFTDYSLVKIAKNRDVDVIFLARFVSGKGMKFLYEIERRLAEGGFSLHVVGSGPLRREAPGRHVYESTDPYSLLGRAKVFLSIQEEDNYPSQSLLEAMASECAVVATDVGQTRLLLDNQTAELVAPTAEAIFSGIMSLLTNPDRASRIGKAARARAVESQTIERFGQYFLHEILGH